MEKAQGVIQSCCGGILKVIWIYQTQISSRADGSSYLMGRFDLFEGKQLNLVNLPGCSAYLNPGDLKPVYFL